MRIEHLRSQRNYLDSLMQWRTTHTARITGGIRLLLPVTIPQSHSAQVDGVQLIFIWASNSCRKYSCSTTPQVCDSCSIPADVRRIDVLELNAHTIAANAERLFKVLGKSSGVLDVLGRTDASDCSDLNETFNQFCSELLRARTAARGVRNIACEINCLNSAYPQKNGSPDFTCYREILTGLKV